MQERDFKGVWIPKEVWLDDRLNALDKIILVEINSLDGEKGCWASNDYIAEFCQCSTSKVSRSIKKLCDLQYLFVESFNGRLRVLRSCIGKNPRQIKQIADSDEANLPSNNIYNNTVINKSPYSPPRDRNEIFNEDLFKKFWEAYPQKVGKQAAIKAWNKIKPDETLLTVMLKTLGEQKKQKKWQDREYIPYPATWLNGKRWEDETDEERRKKEPISDERFAEIMGWGKY